MFCIILSYFVEFPMSVSVIQPLIAVKVYARVNIDPGGYPRFPRQNHSFFLWIAITFNVTISILFGFGLDLVLLLKYSKWRVYLFKSFKKCCMTFSFTSFQRRRFESTNRVIIRKMKQKNSEIHYRLVISIMIKSYEDIGNYSFNFLSKI